jgi:tetratricopeptide (TPR) repeat protein
MDARLAILAAAQVVLATGIASADTNKKALGRQLFELGIEEYKAKQYDAAVASMGKAYALDPQPDTLYALAQSQRLANNCKDAITNYQKLLDTTKDESTLSTVKASLALCQQIESGQKPASDQLIDPKSVEQRDAPTIQIRTVYRTERHNDRLTIAMYAVGGVALGGAATTYLLARSTRNDADHATSLADYNDLYDRAARLRWVSYGAATVGLALVGVATYRVIWGNKDTPPDVALVPVSGGSLLAWSTSW